MNKNGGSFIVNHASHFVNGLQRNIFTAGDMPLPVFVGGANIQQDCAIRSAISKENDRNSEEKANILL